MPNEPASPFTGLIGGRCGEAGELCDAADEPPPEASGEKPPPLSSATVDSGREEAVKDATSEGVALKIVKPFVSNPGG